MTGFTIPIKSWESFPLETIQLGWLPQRSKSKGTLETWWAHIVIKNTHSTVIREDKQKLLTLYKPLQDLTPTRRGLKLTSLITSSPLESMTKSGNKKMNLRRSQGLKENWTILLNSDRSVKFKTQTSSKRLLIEISTKLMNWPFWTRIKLSGHWSNLEVLDGLRLKKRTTRSMNPI